ncbi:MAG TPA: hypothetical protein VGK32_17550 [Vicinamibacterales bacterium]|jgi:sulfatase maturation enzyme AslB (radical SAM superfamily)
MSAAARPPRGAPFDVIAKPIGPSCNLACRYCSYLENEHLSSGPGSWTMPGGVLETFIRDYTDSRPTAFCSMTSGAPGARALEALYSSMSFGMAHPQR